MPPPLPKGLLTVQEVCELPTPTATPALSVVTGTAGDEGGSVAGLLPPSLMRELNCGAESVATRADLDTLDEEIEGASVADNLFLSLQVTPRWRPEKMRPRLVNRRMRAVGTEGVASQKVFYEDKEVLLQSLKRNPFALELASDELKDDFEVVMCAVCGSGDVLEYASQNMRANREVVLAAVGCSKQALEFASAELRADRDLVLAAVLSHGIALKFASRELQADFDVVKAAVSCKGSDALEFAASALQSDSDLRELAKIIDIQADPTRLPECSDDLIGEFLARNGLLLEHAKPACQGDYNLVLTAVQQNASALQYASVSLKADRSLVLEAVRMRGEALEFADSALQNDLQVCCTAVRQNVMALYWLGNDICQQPENLDQVLRSVPYEADLPSQQVWLDQKGYNKKVRRAAQKITDCSAQGQRFWSHIARIQSCFRSSRSRIPQKHTAPLHAKVHHEPSFRSRSMLAGCSRICTMRT